MESLCSDFVSSFIIYGRSFKRTKNKINPSVKLTNNVIVSVVLFADDTEILQEY
jgi:hypothetical protein